MTISELKRREEAKRERHWGPRKRWKAIQAMITWVESRPEVRRNTPAACLRKQALFLRSLAERRSRA